MEKGDLKNKIKALLTITKPVVAKLLEEKIIPASKAYMYSALQKRKDRIVNSLLKLLDKYKKEENADKKAAHKLGLTLGIEAIEAIGNGLIESAKELKEAL